jgi:hypothetical protein
MAGLFRELVDLGYKGSYESVRDHIVRQLPRSARRMWREEPCFLRPLFPHGKQPSFSSVGLNN